MFPVHEARDVRDIAFEICKVLNLPVDDLSENRNRSDWQQRASVVDGCTLRLMPFSVMQVRFYL